MGVYAECLQKNTNLGKKKKKTGYVGYATLFWKVPVLSSEIALASP